MGKTTTTLALSLGGTASGLCVLAVDADASRGLSRALGVDGRAATILEGLRRQQPAGVLAEPTPRLLVAAGDSAVREHPLTSLQLGELLAAAPAEVDLIVIDAPADAVALKGPLELATRVVIPAQLDILSLRAAALTIGLAREAGLLDRVCGIALTNTPAALSRTSEALLNGLVVTGIAFDTLLPASPAWGAPLALTTAAPDAALVEASRALLRDVATREAPTAALVEFVAIAQGRRGRAAAVA